MSQITCYNYDKKAHYANAYSIPKKQVSVLTIFLSMIGIIMEVNKANFKSNPKPEKTKL